MSPFIVQVASVVGTTFTAGLLAAMHPMAREATELQADLAALAELRFVRRDDTAANAWCWCQVLVSQHDGQLRDRQRVQARSRP